MSSPGTAGGAWTKAEDAALERIFKARTVGGHTAPWIAEAMSALPHRSRASIQQRASNKYGEHGRTPFSSHPILRALPIVERGAAIIAHRLWDVRPAGRLAFLESVNGRVVWPVCEPMKAHRLEQYDGVDHTGIHAFKRPQSPEAYLKSYSVDKRVTLVHGTVYLWGRVIEHEHGYRAEFAYPDVLIVQEAALAQALRQTYGCETLVGEWRGFRSKAKGLG